MPGFENVYLATGHSMSGIILAPATGFFLSEFIMTGQAADLMQPFAAERITRR